MNDRVQFQTVGKRPGLHVWESPAKVMSHSHIHTDIEWNFITSGAMHYFFAGRFLTLHERQLAVFWGGMPHRLISTTPPANCIIVTIPIAWFYQWHLPETFSRNLLAGEFYCDTKTAPDEDRKLMQRWIEDLGRGSAELNHIVILEVEARLRRYAHEMAGGGKLPEGNRVLSNNGSQIERVTKFVAGNYQTSICVGDIAAAVQLHPKYLMQMFKRNCGMRLWEYVQYTRISHAQRLLLMSDMKLLDIAMDSGFGSASRFYATFKDVCGVTPRVYRKKKSSFR
ncbi:MAG: hypothetical protein C0404_01855 [Verrucomicrobia bacterium]|nr:hypothetical protein [Verrucomicrobiota bacterium]